MKRKDLSSSTNLFPGKFRFTDQILPLILVDTVRLLHFIHQNGNILVMSELEEQLMVLLPGANYARIVTLPCQYTAHKVEGNHTEYILVKCSKYHGLCQICNEGGKPYRRWLIGVVDRRNSEYRILDLNTRMYGRLQIAARSPGLGDPTTYDVNFAYEPKGCVQVIPQSKSDSKLDMSSFSTKTDFLKRYCTPPTPEETSMQYASAALGVGEKWNRQLEKG